jgi:hypothetical protein
MRVLGWIGLGRGRLGPALFCGASSLDQWAVSKRQLACRRLEGASASRAMSMNQNGWFRLVDTYLSIGRHIAFRSVKMTGFDDVMREAGWTRHYTSDS